MWNRYFVRIFLFMIFFSFVIQHTVLAASPKYCDIKHEFPELDVNKARVFFYKDKDMLDPWGAPIRFNGEKVGTIHAGKFFYVDVDPGRYRLDFGKGFIMGMDKFIYILPNSEMFVNVYYKDRGRGIVTGRIKSRVDAEKEMDTHRMKKIKKREQAVPDSIWLDELVLTALQNGKFEYEDTGFYSDKIRSESSSSLLVSPIIDLRQDKTIPLQDMYDRYEYGQNGELFYSKMIKFLEEGKGYSCNISDIELTPGEEVDLYDIINKMDKLDQDGHEWILLILLIDLKLPRSGGFMDIEMATVIFDKETKDVLWLNYGYVDLEELFDVFQKQQTGTMGIIGAFFESIKNSMGYHMVKADHLVGSIVAAVPEAGGR